MPEAAPIYRAWIQLPRLEHREYWATHLYIPPRAIALRRVQRALRRGRAPIGGREYLQSLRAPPLARRRPHHAGTPNGNPRRALDRNGSSPAHPRNADLLQGERNRPHRLIFAQTKIYPILAILAKLPSERAVQISMPQ